MPVDLFVILEHRPGELTRQLADANGNIDLAYTTFGGVKIVIATEDMGGALAGPSAPTSSTPMAA